MVIKRIVTLFKNSQLVATSCRDSQLVDETNIVISVGSLKFEDVSYYKLWMIYILFTFSNRTNIELCSDGLIRNLNNVVVFFLQRVIR